MSVWRLPPISKTAESEVALMSFTPSAVDSPADIVRAFAPSITTTALPAVSPITVTSAASAPDAGNPAPAASVAQSSNALQ